MKYVLLTKFWNEEENIPDFVAGVAKQTVRPIVWFLLDDGSTDNSCSVFEREAATHGFKTISVRGATKRRGNLNTIGHIYQLCFQKYRKELFHDIRPDFLAMLDVDSYPPPQYFETLLRTLKLYPRIGCIAGQMRNDRKRRTMPMGSGKVVRWNVVIKAARSSSGIWDLDIDSFLNIKAVALGYWLVIVDDLFVEGKRSFFWSKTGRQRMGGRMFYVGRPFPLVFMKALRLLLGRDNGLRYLLGYVEEAIKGSWKCSDYDVRKFYRTLYPLSGFCFLKVIRRTHIEKLGQ